MAKKNKRRSDCPISFSLDIFGDRWSLLIIRDLMFKGKTTYGEFLASDEKIATNILAHRLTLLEAAGLVKSKGDPENKTRILYSLTEKGLDLVRVLTELVSWGAKYDKNTGAPEEFIARLKNDKEDLIREIISGHRSQNGHRKKRLTPKGEF